MLDRLGGQRVGIIRDTLGQRGTLGTRSRNPDTIWVDNCLFETELTSEEDAEGAVSTVDAAWCFMPVVSGHVSAVDDNDTTVLVAVTDITSTARIMHGGKEYQMQDDAVLEFDDAGAEDHVFCRCVRRRT